MCSAARGKGVMTTRVSSSVFIIARDGSAEYQHDDDDDNSQWPEEETEDSTEDGCPPPPWCFFGPGTGFLVILKCQFAHKPNSKASSDEADN